MKIYLLMSEDGKEVLNSVIMADDDEQAQRKLKLSVLNPRNYRLQEVSVLEPPASMWPEDKSAT